MRPASHPHGWSKARKSLGSVRDRADQDDSARRASSSRSFSLSCGPAPLPDRADFRLPCAAFTLVSGEMAVFGHGCAGNGHSGTAPAILTLIAEALFRASRSGEAVAGRSWEASEPAGIRGTGIGWRAEIDLSVARL